MESSSNKFIKKIFKGVLISLVVSFVLLAIFAIVLTYTSVSENTIVPVIIVVTGISILVGTILESRKIVKNGIWLGGIIGLIYVLILYIISSLLNADFSINIQSFILILVAIFSGMIGGIIGVNNRK